MVETVQYVTEAGELTDTERPFLILCSITGNQRRPGIWFHTLHGFGCERFDTISLSSFVIDCS